VRCLTDRRSHDFDRTILVFFSCASWIGARLWPGVPPPGACLSHRSGAPKLLRHCVYRHFVPISTKAADDPRRHKRYYRIMVIRLAPKDVRYVNLDDGQIDRFQRIEKDNRIKRVPGRIDNDAGRTLSSLMNPFDKLAFVVGLSKIACKAKAGDDRCTALLNFPQCHAAVYLRFPNSQQIQIWAVEYVDVVRLLGHGLFGALGRSTRESRWRD
jgi:hypothetical protein